MEFWIHDYKEHLNYAPEYGLGILDFVIARVRVEVTFCFMHWNRKLSQSGRSLLNLGS